MRDHLSSLQKVSSQLGIKLRPLQSPINLSLSIRLGFQIWMTITIQIQFQDDHQVDDHNFHVILI